MNGSLQESPTFSGAGTRPYKKMIRRARNCLTCSRASKRAFVRRYEEDLRLYLEENPECSGEDVAEVFGTPQQMAQNFMETVDEKEVAAARRIRKVLTVSAVVLGVAMSVVALTLLFNPLYRPEVIITTTIYSDEPLPQKYQDLLKSDEPLDESPRNNSSSSSSSSDSSSLN